MGIIKEFTIKRSEWARGYRGPHHTNKLLDAGDSKRCCIGFYVQACGVEDERSLDMGSVRDLLDDVIGDKKDEENSIYPHGVQDVLDSVDVSDANEDDFFDPLYEINDDADMADEVREAMIITTFASKGVKVNFID